MELTYDAVTSYIVFAGILAVLFWATLVLLVLSSRRRRDWLRWFGLMAVVAMAALFWTTSAVMRITGTVNPFLLNTWSRILYAMLAFYVLSVAWINRSVLRG